MDARGGRRLIGGLAVVLVALLVAIGMVVTSRGATDDRLSEGHREVASAARAQALAFLTVDHTDMDPLLDAVLDGATGDFAEQYAAQRETLAREAVRTEATSAGEVVALGVGDLEGDAEGDIATVLVAANSTVTNTSTGSEGEVRYYRLRLDLVREDGRWLTSDVEFVR